MSASFFEAQCIFSVQSQMELFKNFTVHWVNKYMNASAHSKMQKLTVILCHQYTVDRIKLLSADIDVMV